MNTRELHEKRAQLQAQAAQIIAVVDTEKRTLNSDEAAKFDALSAQIKEVDATLERLAISEEIEKRQAKNIGGQTPEAKEINKRFSLAKMVLAAADPTRLVGFEKEMHEEAQNERRAIGITGTTAGVGIPYKALKEMRAAILAGAALDGTGAGLVKHADLSFIEQLQSAFIGAEMGVQMLTGLNGRLPIGRGKSFTASWRAENTENTTTSGATDRAELYPHTLTALAQISKELMMQGDASESYIQKELIKAINAALMAALINGPGLNGAPTGILNTSGIGDVAGGTNGAAPTWPNIVALEGKVPADTGVQSLAYLTNSKARAKMKATARIASTDSRAIMEDSFLNGYKAYISEQVPSNLVKGTSGAVCSAIIFGDFSQAMVGQWGGLDLLVDPYSQKKYGLLELSIDSFWDVFVKQPSAFAAIKDVLTA